MVAGWRRDPERADRNGVLLEELLDELQAAIATTPQVMPSAAANRLFDDRKGSIP
jgi:hypothetical protein